MARRCAAGWVPLKGDEGEGGAGVEEVEVQSAVTTAQSQGGGGE